ncbi:hypothetical protein [Dokdonia donghaensis]|uniref:hypothetical protein n=1 Tax=Dokdonia donghaensis TaxID=326320 RepID=UPI0007DCD9BC|nr:hypothetical protein [Dokdonia donghaensis]ANH59389.1 hypothetical protein I597_0457 [Dokdonia donghaensis DSW-1]
MNKNKIAGIIVMAIAGILLYAFDDTSGGVGFVTGAMMAIGLGFFLGLIPARKNITK